MPGLLLLVFCFLGGMIWTADPYRIDPTSVLLAPGVAHPVGTDALGRDVLARLIAGGADTLRVALPAAAIAFVLGVAYGLAAGLGPAWVDRALMRLLDAVLALPSLVVLLSVGALLPPEGLAIAPLIGAVAWPPLARLVRGEARAVVGRDFVVAAVQAGAGPVHVARFHVLPVMGRLLLVNATLLVGDAILGVAALHFLGLGVQPPHTGWGEMLHEGIGLVELGAWWLILPAGGLIAASLFAVEAAGRRLLRA